MKAAPEKPSPGVDAVLAYFRGYPDDLPTAREIGGVFGPKTLDVLAALRQLEKEGRVRRMGLVPGEGRTWKIETGES